MVKNKIKIAGIALFCAMLGIFGLSFCILPQKEYSDQENRLLQTRPKLVWEELFNGSYQEHYEAYLNDQLPDRDRWVQAAAKMEQWIGKREINGVYIGKDGYLLEKFDAIEYDPMQVKENTAFLSQFLNAAVKRYGKKRVSCIILPDKAGAMPDKLPPFAPGNVKAQQKARNLNRHAAGTAKAPVGIYLLPQRPSLDDAWSLLRLLRLGEKYRT